MRPEGDNTGDGIKRQLGKSELAKYAVLVREATQNSWDARRRKAISVTFSVERIGDRVDLWKQRLREGEGPEEILARIDRLESEDLILVVSDRGTTGLVGPIRSDVVSAKGAGSSFVRFMRNTGDSHALKANGGTYGFGKGILYSASEVSTIFVDTKNVEEGETSRRFMGATLSSPFNGADGRRYTGRHWWGEVNDDVPDPILGSNAAEISEALGFPGFEEEETGTDIAILLPTLEEGEDHLSAKDLACQLRGHVYWNLWSKFRADGTTGIDFKVLCDGEELEMPRPDQIPVICDLYGCLEDIRSGSSTTYTLKKYLPERLGNLSLKVTAAPMRQTESAAVASIMEYSSLKEPYRHVARMRQPELVVDYMIGSPMADSMLGYVGVFKTSPFSDEYFAEAEPPTHENWLSTGLRGSARGIVRNAVSFIREECKKQIGSHLKTKSKMILGLGRVSRVLGEFVEGFPERDQDGDKGGSPKSAGSGGERNGDFKILGPARVAVHRGKPVVERQCRVNSKHKTIILEAKGFVLLANGRKEPEENRPNGESKLRFLGWFKETDGEPIETSPVLRCPLNEHEIYSARYEFIPDAAVEISITGESH
ncbi:hypothetical protein [Corynebacterium pyruviciproducens]|uniref:hypothetical protein n=1 Tax=Corynebacterium pyruviciproducens TaxID=598660 RepID=UPI0028895C7F|nr:hypothetical protein [Corynebacterium pyruviciproducens]